jgi:hypothetical protein
MVHGGVAQRSDGSLPILRIMLMQTLRLLMLRVLPRRLVPFLTVIELILLVRRMRRRAPQPAAPRRLVTVNGPDRPAN